MNSSKNLMTSQRCNQRSVPVSPPRETKSSSIVKQKAASKSTNSTNAPNDRVYVKPTDNDVLRGRGGRINSHPGKKRLLDLVRPLGKEYALLKRGEKGKMGRQIVDQVHAWGGRFLEMETDGMGTDRYFELDMRSAVKLVEQKFRDDPNKRKAKNNSSNNSSSSSSTSSSQSKQAIRKLKKKPVVDDSDDDEEYDVEMELQDTHLSSVESRQKIITRLNKALSNLEDAPTDPEVTPVDAPSAAAVVELMRQNSLFSCISPSHSSGDDSETADAASADELEQSSMDELSREERAAADESTSEDSSVETAEFEELTLDEFINEDFSGIAMDFPPPLGITWQDSLAFFSQFADRSFTITEDTDLVNIHIEKL